MTQPPAAITPARPIRSIDLTYRKRDYRIREDIRTGDAKVTYLSPRSMPLECSGCGRLVKHGSPVVIADIYGMHPGCAIKHGLMTETPESVQRREEEARRARAVGEGRL